MKQLVVVCLLAARAYADASVSSSRAPIGWRATCVTALQRAAATVKTRFGIPGSPVDFSRSARARLSTDCERDAETLILVNSGSAAAGSYQLSFRTNGLGDETIPDLWTVREDEKAKVWRRRGPARFAAVAIYPPSAAAEIATVFREALDVCMATAPEPAALPEPLSTQELAARCASSTARERCQDAESAAWEIDHSCVVEGSAIGSSGTPGHTLPRLARITALGPDATPILLRLAGSKNPTARAIAADGFAKVHSTAGREMLQSLKRDRGVTEVLGGCLRTSETVGSFAKSALETY